MNVHIEEDRITELYYGIAPSEGEVEHLAGCEQCRGSAEELRRVLDAVREMPVPDPGEQFEEAVWGRVRWGMRRRQRQTLTVWWGAAAAVVLVIGAFLAGRVMQQTVSAVPQMAAPAEPVSAEGRQRVMLAFVGDHLDRTQLLLLEVVNSDERDLPRIAERANELVVDNRLSRETVEAAGQDQLSELLGELEPVLIELSHAEPGAERTALLRSRSEAVLFRVRVISPTLQKPKDPGPLPGERSSI